jgi:hypothetical protein
MIDFRFRLPYIAVRLSMKQTLSSGLSNHRDGTRPSGAAEYNLGTAPSTSPSPSLLPQAIVTALSSASAERLLAPHHPNAEPFLSPEWLPLLVRPKVWLRI